MTTSTSTFDADAYWQSGKMPWTIFAYPSSLADSQGLPRDDEAKRFLAALRSAGVRVAIWRHPDIDDTIYFACSVEDRFTVQFAIEDFERAGNFPVNFPAERCEYLFSIAARST